VRQSVYIEKVLPDVERVAGGNGERGGWKKAKKGRSPVSGRGHGRPKILEKGHAESRAGGARVLTLGGRNQNLKKK